MLTDREWQDVETYDRYTAEQLAERDRTEPAPYTLAEHLDAQISFHQEEIAFQGAEIGTLQIVKTRFRKNKLIVGLCDMHARICDDIMQEAMNAVERLKAEKKSCRV